MLRGAPSLADAPVRQSQMNLGCALGPPRQQLPRLLGCPLDAVEGIVGGRVLRKGHGATARDQEQRQRRRGERDEPAVAPR
jgi:hypothetical protein